MIKHYGAEKDRRGLLDYDDLIDKAGEMLAQVNPGWVHYKLDLGLDHVLIDEAQDTSEKQWRIVRHLVAEFAAGAGARGLLTRTLFAVGDEKQSIFSFQGAAPRKYEEMRRYFAKLFGALRDRVAAGAVRPLVPLGAERARRGRRGVRRRRHLSQHHHRRSRHAQASGAAGRRAGRRRNLADDRGGAERRRSRAGMRRSTRCRNRARARKLAEKIAATVRGWIASGAVVGAERRPLTAGDVLVLVRQRGPLFEAIIRALKNAGVAVAGADRLVLTEHIAIVDLMALADALLLPQDDLALAVALKSPLFGFDDDLLFDLAWNRRAQLARRPLPRAPAENPIFAAADALLDRCAAMARHATPFAFFAWLLGPELGRQRMFARLGRRGGGCARGISRACARL